MVEGVGSAREMDQNHVEVAAKMRVFPHRSILSVGILPIAPAPKTGRVASGGQAPGQSRAGSQASGAAMQAAGQLPDRAIQNVPNAPVPDDENWP